MTKTPFYKPWTPYLYLLLPMGLLAVFFLWPLVSAWDMSLKDYSHHLYNPPPIGLGNYQTLLKTPSFYSALGNTLWMVVGVVPAMVLLPILMALLFHGQLRGLALFRTLVYIPVITSVVVVGIAWKWLYAQEGLFNYLLSLVGLPAQGWLINPDVAMGAVILVIIWKGLAYYMMMYLAHLQSISSDLLEAARVDGANGLQQLWYVMVPQLKPTMGMVALISTIGCLKLFTEIFVLTRGGPLQATETLVYFIYRRAFEQLDLGLSAAAGFVLMAILLILSWIQIKSFGDAEGLEGTAKPSAKALDPLPHGVVKGGGEIRGGAVS